ncbi:hypothetical protein A2837_00640 [Candidatus Kaiserbacteria bacterium RIFCSPHIGHO2_01_FULL_46_22]|uniref:Band 7 domain-containing protein n=1 Tax=Candidatus Kaiserbacteria bacterium RIFCSPHIGHO2_01_FULL_46_22 TaxID=1798475 RepID=A0A1F6BXG5_9BACT|nr:MAG: hypothetical protein A2837_00640 [Candidatus Kaiserbacteria bacterium RIFCSPHIGHO2_01_FULL_46_22]
MTTLIDSLTFGLAATVIIGSYLGFWIVLFVMPLIPTFIERLTNKPNRDNPGGPLSERDYSVSEFGYFTEVLPGRVKIIERGGEFIRCIMSYEGHIFRGEISGENLRPNDDDYWEVRETLPESENKDSHPLPWKTSAVKWVFFLFTIPWWIWKRWVFKVTGFVFTGIYPFQRVRTYPLEYFKKLKHGGGEDEIIRVEDYSDHFRVADFQFPVRVPSADTKDKIPVRVFMDLMARVFNPYQTAYWIDDWSSRLSAATVDGVTHFTRGREYDNVISIMDPKKGRDLSKEIMKSGNSNRVNTNSVKVIGISISQALVMDISPVREEDGVRLGEVARARVDRDSTVIRAEGRAAEIDKQAAVVRSNGAIGLAVLAAERNVRTASAAGDKAIVVIGGGGDTDPIQAAILHELKKQNEDPQP